MHGLVILDENDQVIRPAILWNDGRTAKQVDYLNHEIGKDKLSKYTGNIAFAGFTAPKILWVKENEPENFARIAKIMLPKDYINYILTGVHACDYSDASGMLLLDVANKCWSKEMLEICGVTESQMPKLFESYEIVGTLFIKLCHPDQAKRVEEPSHRISAVHDPNAKLPRLHLVQKWASILDKNFEKQMTVYAANGVRYANELCGRRLL